MVFSVEKYVNNGKAYKRSCANCIYWDLIISSTPNGAKLVDLECATEQTGETREAER